MAGICEGGNEIINNDGTISCEYPSEIATNYNNPESLQSNEFIKDKLVSDAYSEIGKNYQSRKDLSIFKNNPNYNKYGLCINLNGCSSYDCSSLVSFIYSKQGFDIGGNTRLIAKSKLLYEVSKEDIQAGDILIWYADGNHASIATGNGTNISAHNTKYGIVELNLFTSTKVINKITGKEEISNDCIKTNLLKVLRLKKLG